MPKTLAENYDARQNLRKAAYADKSLQCLILGACRSSCIYWINMFAWTYLQRKFMPDGTLRIVKGAEAHIPFVTWPIQDEVIQQVIECIESGESVNFEKSRDMGATWIILAIFTWYWLFHSEVNFGVVSRKEDLVDSKGDMDSLFEKIRYMISMLPKWMVPEMRSRYMHIHNLELNSTIAGESTNQDVGRGGRKTAYAIDEAAAINNGEEIENALSYTTGTQVWISTPKGPQTQFHKRILAGRGRLVQMPWWRHPDKSIGAHQIIDPETKKVKWTSLWYQKECSEKSRRAIAQEVDLDHGSAGEVFFDYTEIERHKSDFVEHPHLCGHIRRVKPVTPDERESAIRKAQHHGIEFVPDSDKRSTWRMWLALENGRPPQDNTYIFGADIGTGTGASNSVITVLAKESGRIVAKFWDSYTPPEELALVMMEAAVWFGGMRKLPFLIWENNGPGGYFGRKIVHLGYPRFYRDRNDTTKENKKTPRYGWNNSGNGPDSKKARLLAAYRDALSCNRIINPCEEALEEAKDYIYDDHGRLVPAKLREEPTGGHSLHGDHVIADALVVLGTEEIGKHKATVQRPPKGSFAYRRELREKRRKDADPWRR